MCFANLTLDAINFGIKNLERFANFVGQGVMGWFGKKDVGKLDLSGWMIENPERFTKSGEDAANAYYGAYARTLRSEEHTSELQYLMRTSYAVFCLKKKKLTLEKLYTYEQQS